MSADIGLLIFGLGDLESSVISFPTTFSATDGLVGRHLEVRCWSTSVDENIVGYSYFIRQSNIMKTV